MKQLLVGIIIGIVPYVLSAQQATKTPADYVNPFIGASTSVGAAGVYHGLGKTIPGATTPFGMVQLGPNTITGGDNGSGYSYEHKTLEGFAFTQMSGIGWYGDLGNLLVTPTTGKLSTYAGKEGKPGGYRSQLDKSSEEATCGYYKVLLATYGIEAEMTSAPHSGILKFKFPRHAQSRIQIDLARRVGGTSTEQYIKVVNDTAIIGWMKCTPEGGGWGNGDGHASYTVYFYATFSKPLKQVGIWSANIPDTAHRKRENITADYYQQWVADASIHENLRELKGKHLGFYTQFATNEGEEVLMKAGISFVDIAGAKRNLETEIPSWNFKKVRIEARQRWNKFLRKISITGGTEEERTVFYTALYRTMLDPRTLQDLDGRYPRGDGKIGITKNGNTRRTIFSGWDVFRSQMPLQTLINPSVVNDMLASLIDLAGEKQKNYFERWELLNAYSGCMIGNPAVNVLADAYVKGIRNYDVEKAYNLAVGSVEQFGNGEKGYTAGGLSISQTLEYAYNEWCVSLLAKKLNKPNDEKKYAIRANSYKALFDPAKESFRPKEADGSWAPWPEGGRETEGYGCIETNPSQQGWFVPHDLDGLATLLGGKEKMLQELTHFFEKTPNDFHWNAFYNHANEPVHHVPFLFNRLGKPSLTQYWTREICQKAYHNAVEKGLVGNEDVGQMSAWYVMAAAGIHPICPGDGRFEITSPVFKKINIQLDPAYPTRKTLTIIAPHNSKTNRYIQSITWNGKPYHKSYITYETMRQGGLLVLEMGKTPNDNLETK
ncbi:alpha-1,2-mannosidase, putative [bacterium A37T11]|nr:alpha-1,2-mannosidase, putative [bacterium A37T11]